MRNGPCGDGRSPSADPAEFAALVALVRDGGVVVSTTVWMPAPGDDERGVRSVDMYVRSDAGQLAELVARVDRGELTVDVAQRVPLSERSAEPAGCAWEPRWNLGGSRIAVG